MQLRLKYLSSVSVLIHHSAFQGFLTKSRSRRLEFALGYVSVVRLFHDNICKLGGFLVLTILIFCT